MSRRGRGEGSIHRHKTHGLWVASISVGATGKRKRRIAYGHSRSEANEKLQGLLDHADLTPSDETVGAFLARWLKIIPPEVKPRSHAKFEQDVRLHINPALGKVKLAKLNALMVQEFISAKTAAGMAPQSVIHLRNTLRNAFNRAMRLNLLERSPVAQVEVPRLPDTSVVPLSAPESERLLECARENRLHAFYVLALTIGARRGELLGLKWTDVDLASGRLTIIRALQRVEKQGLQITETKTPKAKRTVRLPKFAISALRTHHKQQLEERLISGPDWNNDHDLIFTNRDGQPLEPITLHRNFKALLKRAGLPASTRVHDLRHTAATFLLSRGVPLKLVQEILGHSSLAVTERFYAHFADEMKQQAADIMDAVFGDPSS
jgi:integrase